MKVLNTKLDGVLRIVPEPHEDFRGKYVEMWNEKEFAEHGIPVHFVTHDFSTSFYGVLRGLHGDEKTYKLIWCGYGRLYLAVVNYDDSSPQFGRWDAFILTGENHHLVLVPPKFGNGHLVLSPTAMFCYMQSEYFDPKSQFSIRFDDPRFKIWWPLKNPILSQRDEAGKYVE